MKRILVPIVGQGSITHIIRTGILQQMKEFCNPVVALLWNEEELVAELREQGYEVSFIPAYKISNQYSGLKSKINIWYLNHKLKTPSVNIQQKYLALFKQQNPVGKLRKQLREKYYKFKFHFYPHFIAGLITEEQSLIKQQEAYADYSNWLANLNIDGLFTVTPFLAEVDLMARILKLQQKPVLASIHSFDNVTKRGWQSILFDHYIVWNKYNKAELERIYVPLQKDNAITIAGAPQFDFHYNSSYALTKEDWMKTLGIPPGKKIILYGGGPASLFPDEPQYLKAIKDAFEEGTISSDNVVLFRCHPLDKVERWKEYVGHSNHIIYDSAPSGEMKLDYVNVKDDDIKKLISTLKHTDVHINVVSTMAVDGSVFNKPQIGPYYDDIHLSKQHLFRNMYFQEHYLPIVKSKAVSLPKNKADYISMVNEALQDPFSHTSHNADCVKEIITYTDGQSSNRAVTAIKSFFAA